MAAWLRPVTRCRLPTRRPPSFKNGVGVNFSCAINDSLVTRARNYLTYQFLHSPATHLMWIDADIGFDPLDIVKMVRADKDIVCGIYPKKEIHWRAVAQAAKENVPPERLRDHENSLVLEPHRQLPGAGDARRPDRNRQRRDRLHVDQALRVRSPRRRRAVLRRRFDSGHRTQGVLRRQHRSRFGNSLLSEDYHFCKLARDRGFKIYAAPWVRLNPHRDIHIRSPRDAHYIGVRCEHREYGLGNRHDAWPPDRDRSMVERRTPRSHTMSRTYILL